jgi:tetratricopeptide (TPR) repeat protein
MGIQSNLSRFFYRLRIIDYKIEFLVIIAWLIFFPDKESHLYFSGTAFLLCLFLLRDIYFMRTLSLSYFAYFLAGFNFILVLSAFFARYQLAAVLQLVDLMLFSCYFILFYHDRDDGRRYYRLLVYVISLFSLLNILRHVGAVPFLQPDRPFFISTIHEGILSGMGVLILVYRLLKALDGRFIALLLLNIAGVYISRSKAAFFGTIIFVILLAVLYIFSRLEKKLRLRFLLGGAVVLAVLAVLTVSVPNPIKSAVRYSLEKDPYALNRLDIWKMSLKITRDHLLTGVGLDNFSRVSGKYNFKQTRGPANYFKRPRITHNDYLKLLCETGLAGLAIILLLFYLLARKIFSSSLSGRFNISMVLLLYLLFQAFFFNVLFRGFFFFIFLFLLQDFLEERVVFESFSSYFKPGFTCLLILIFTAGYLFPWISGGFLKRGREASNPMEAFALLDNAGYLNPLDQDIYYAKASVLHAYFKKTANLEAFYDALSHLKKAQRLNSYFTDAYLLEAEFYLELLKRNVKYDAMGSEIIGILERAEAYAPVDPFIKLTKARVYLEFGNRDRAREEALKAVALEPEFVSALYFLRENFGYFGEEKGFEEKIDNILQKARGLNPRPGQYLYKLYGLPGGRR